MSITKTGVKLFVIAFIATAALGAVYSITEPVIMENERSYREGAMAEVLTGIQNPVFSEEQETGNRYGIVSYFFATSGTEAKPVGYVVYVVGKGDQGDITVCVGLDANGVVLGVQLVTHEETPGLGSNAAKPGFLSQFSGKEGKFNTVQNQSFYPQDIVAVTAATNSSRAVVNAVNEAWVFYHEKLSWGGGSNP